MSETPKMGRKSDGRIPSGRPLIDDELRVS